MAVSKLTNKVFKFTPGCKCLGLFYNIAPLSTTVAHKQHQGPKPFSEIPGKLFNVMYV